MRAKFGWRLGAVSVFLGALSVFAVLCFHFPEVLTTPELREIYPMPLMRGILAASIAIAFALALASFFIAPGNKVGVSGMALCVIAVLFGGSGVEVSTPLARSHYIGLDWFVLDLLILAFIFVPLEKLFPLVKTQRTLREEWQTDFHYFLVTHLLIQVIAFTTVAPAQLLFSGAAFSSLQAMVRQQPLLLQFVELVLVADFTQYWVHRQFHRVPRLWRIHAIHHSGRQMDWLMGSRLHLADILLTRALVFIPMYVLGFATPVINAYLVFIAFHAVFIHANLRFEFRFLRWLVVTPRFHHWHHADEPAAIDKNFAVNLPILDLVFRTSHLPNRWPEAYGLQNTPVPPSFLKQFVWPFRRSSR